MHTYLFALLLAFIARANGKVGSAQDDKITASLPGLTFNPGFDQYAGYLQVSDKHFFYYWLLESQGNPSTDPLILYLMGGPGCSGIASAILMNGPYWVNQDGTTLSENVFSWNKKANLLFIDSPVGVGFSYSTDQNYTTNDDLVAYDNYLALIAFFNKFTQYQKTDFYISGVSYGGVYVPTLASLVVDGTKNKQFNGNLKGIAIGNGLLSTHLQHNTVIAYMFHHGLIGIDQLEKLNQACCNTSSSCSCDYFKALVPWPKIRFMYNSDNTLCGNLTYDISEGLLWYLVGQYEYDIYQDCYVTDAAKREEQLTRMRVALPQFFRPGNNVNNINYESTDPFNGFLCWNPEASTTYINLAAFKAAAHVQPINQTFSYCSKLDYTTQYSELDAVFAHILNNSDIRILIYNGDVDLVQNILMAEYFVTRVAAANKLGTLISRHPWSYRGVVGGYAKHFDRIDLVTVKGAGHDVPGTRPGPALQMIMNFIWNTGNYSNPTGINVTPKTQLTSSEATTTPTTTTTPSTPTTPKATTTSCSTLYKLCKPTYYALMLITISLQFM